MAKRTADNQRTKDDDDEENGEEPGVRDTPIAPVQGRVVRGLPKRKGLGGTPAPTPAAPVASVSGTHPFSSLSSSAPAAPNPFTFGQSAPPASTAPPAASNAFSGFSFGAQSTPTTPASGTPPATEAPKPAPTSTFSFGSKPAEAAAPAKASPFAGFSFGAPPAATPAPTQKKDEAPKAAFTFGNSASAAPAAEKETPKAPSGFGSSTFGSNPAGSAAKPAFSFGAPATESEKKDANKTSAPAPFSFGITQKEATTVASKEATQTPAFAFGKPAAPVASEKEPTPAARVEAPSIGPTGNGLTAPNSTSSLSVPAPAASTAVDASSETSFLTSLRGLNQSFHTFFASIIEKDPFIDLSEVLPNLGKQYEKHLEEIGSKSGWKPEKSGAAVEKTADTPKAGGFTLPKAPEGGFAVPKPTAASGTTATGGFTPSAPASASTASGFSFSAVAPASKKSSEGATKIISDVLANKPEEKKAPFSFSVGTDAEKPQGSTPPSTGFSFSAPKKSTSLFSTTPATPAKASSAESGTPLGKFGPGGSQPQLSFGVKAGTSPSASTTGSFSFSAKPATPAGSTGFSFGSASSTPSGTPAAAPSGGFSFGSTAAAASSAFSFGKPADGGATGSSAPSASAPAESTEASEETPGSPSKNLAETAGAGEENEDTVLEQRGKLSRLEDGKYELEGLGQFKLKKEKAEGGKRRLLMRTDGNGNVILNMTFKSTFKPTADGPYIKFLGFNKDGKPTPYALRVKNAEVAKTVAEKLEKEAGEAQ
ncbi:hypothetical protein I350_03642 [Cryptococcus amylolentus CBS 6273]|uniref:RanBD1 domain-containing protein n=1 Tax=Cryptococcus amylolentus CBS 6273 TaxID=1296118 RepID=A0A1E3K4P6_9TREE|nr:hypothetical protein I350_03642 [Cryptococcus amylolentus CBS 6273]